MSPSIKPWFVVYGYLYTIYKRMTSQLLIKRSLWYTLNLSRYRHWGSSPICQYTECLAFFLLIFFMASYNFFWALVSNIQNYGFPRPIYGDFSIVQLSCYDKKKTLASLISISPCNRRRRCFTEFFWSNTYFFR